MQKNAFHEIWTCFLVKFFERYAFVIVIKFKKHHLVFTVWTFQRVITERGKNSSSPLIEAAINRMFTF